MTTETLTRSAVVDRLGINAASALDMASQLKEAHWLVTGPNFIALHELFDRQASMMRDHVDGFAERMRELDGVPHGTISQAAQRSQLEDFPAELSGEREILQTLVDRYDTLADDIERSAKQADDEGDIATADLYVQVLRSINLQRWFLESHLEDGA